MSDSEGFEKYRKLIAWAEIAGLLHDIGKLSSKWLEYRRLWQDPKNPAGWRYDNDPHLAVKTFTGAPDDGTKEWINTSAPCVSDFNEQLDLADVIEHHEDKKDQRKLLQLLRFADSIDSALDRNNPLFCREQKGKGMLFDTEVFGQETNKEWTKPPEGTSEKCYLWGAPPGPHKVDPNELDARRKDLYKALENKLKKYLDSSVPNNKDRLEILGAIRKAFDYGMADTIRPGNDTTLWEHTYSTAAIFKTSILHYAETGEPYKTYDQVKFKLLGIGWNGLAFMAGVPRLGDGLGRYNVIKKIICELRKKIEWDLLWGSLVYWDTNQVVFMVADVPAVSNGTAENCLRPVFQTISAGELFPTIQVSDSTSSLTLIITVIDALRKKRHIPIPGLYRNDLDTLEKNSRNPDATLDMCPVCRRRLIQDKNEKRCTICNERRNKAAETSRDENGTVFLSEIARGNGNAGFNRLALVMVHFGLNHWLDGRMHRTMMVTEHDGIENEAKKLGTINGFDGSDADERRNDKKRKESRTKLGIPERYDYAEIIKETARFKEKTNEKDAVSATMFMYGRRTETDVESFLKTCESLRAKFIDEYPGIRNLVDDTGILAAALCTKTPTPSTMLDTWHAPYRFIRDLSPGERQEDSWLGIVNKTDHPVIHINNTRGLRKWCAYIAGKQGHQFEFYIRDENTGIVIDGSPISGNYDVSDPDNPSERIDEITVTVKDPEPYLPVRSVLLSPELGMFLVPAEHAFDIASKIDSMYSEEFSKVRGRLPFDIGLLYFQAKHPMYLVLDSARRMVEGFEKRNRSETITATVSSIAGSAPRLKIDGCQNGAGRIIPFSMDQKLGDGEIDYHHPYIFVEHGENVENRATFFKTVGFVNDTLCGIVHVKDIREGYVVRIAPSSFDFELLDSIERRHSIAYSTTPFQRTSIPYSFQNKPYYLEEISLFKKWRDRLQNEGEEKDFFGRAPTDTEIRGLENMWVSKMLEWEVDLSSPDSESFLHWKSIIETSIKATFSAFNKEMKDPLEKKRMEENFMETVEAATNGLLLDVLQLFLHIQKEGIRDDH